MQVARGGPTGCLGENIDGNSSAARLKNLLDPQASCDRHVSQDLKLNRAPAHPRTCVGNSSSGNTDWASRRTL